MLTFSNQPKIKKQETSEMPPEQTMTQIVCEKMEEHKEDLDPEAKQALEDYLQSCHNLFPHAEVNQLSTFNTIATGPVHCLRPPSIESCKTGVFERHQEKIWNKIYDANTAFTTEELFPSKDTCMKYSLLPETDDKQSSVRCTLEHHVEMLANEVYKIEKLREVLHLQGLLKCKKRSLDATKFRRDHTLIVCRVEGGSDIPIALGEYISPRGLPFPDILAGLRGETDIAASDNDEINNFESKARILLNATITRLFAAMIGIRVQWGYVFTGEAVMFIHVGNDPGIVKYYLSVPSQDAQNDSDGINKLHKTFVAQILVFAIEAATAKKVTREWKNKAKQLSRWDTEYIRIPPSWGSGTKKRPPALSPRTSLDEADTVLSTMPITSLTREQEVLQPDSKPCIEDRRYCTHNCLLGLISGISTPLDENCPNVKDHQGHHQSLKVFLDDILQELANKHRLDTSYISLYIGGTRGTLFKIVSEQGYTFVGKAFMQCDYEYRDQEVKVYKRLRSLQGKQIPVCMGKIELTVPFLYEDCIFDSMILLSWGGQEIYDGFKGRGEEFAMDEAMQILNAVHEHGVLHMDAWKANWVCNENVLMLIDFEKSKIMRSLDPDGMSCIGSKQEESIDRRFEEEMSRARKNLEKLMLGC